MPNNSVKRELPFPRGLEPRTQIGYRLRYSRGNNNMRRSRQIRRYNNSPLYVTLHLIALTQGSKRDLSPLFKFLGGACDLNAWKKLPCSTILPPLIGWSTATRIATYLLYLHHSWLKSHESSSSKWLMNYTMCKCECISFMSCLFQSFRKYMLHGNMQP